MYKIVYYEKLKLLVVCLFTKGMNKEEKDKIRTELQKKTKIKKVLVIEGDFEVIK